jgi:hypothetical protein
MHRLLPKAKDLSKILSQPPDASLMLPRSTWIQWISATLSERTVLEHVLVSELVHSETETTHMKSGSSGNGERAADNAALACLRRRQLMLVS